MIKRNGRWRSQWTLTIGPTNIDIFGFLRIHVHYYENGNVQLVASKEIKESIALTVRFYYLHSLYLIYNFNINIVQLRLKS